jgi:hypothetical protein
MELARDWSGRFAYFALRVQLPILPKKTLPPPLHQHQRPTSQWPNPRRPNSRRSQAKLGENSLLWDIMPHSAQAQMV